MKVARAKKHYLMVVVFQKMRFLQSYYTTTQRKQEQE